MKKAARFLIVLMVASFMLSGCFDPVSLLTNATPSAELNATPVDRAATAVVPGPTLPPPDPAGDVPIDTGGLIRDEVTAADRANAQLLETTDIPIADLRDLAIRFKGLSPDAPEKSCTTTPTLNVGDEQQFRLSNLHTFEQFTVTAKLIDKADHSYMWLDTQWLDQVDQDRLRQANHIFSDEIYPRDRALFGAEDQPGIDCDPRLHILNTADTGAAGFFSSVDVVPKTVRPDSNEKEMFVIDIPGSLGPRAVGSSFYLGVLAHEFQHMIHHRVDLNEDSWANEGLSDLAMFLNGYDTGGHEIFFAQQPDTQLDFWPEGGGGAENYGAAFTFWLYFYDKFGEQGISAIVADPLNGLSGVAEALKQEGYSGTLDDFFADWVIAKYLDRPDLGNGRYGFAKSDPPHAATEESIESFPFSRSDTVHQYAAKYYPLHGSQDVTIDFAGSTKAPLIDAQPHSGQYFMWSNRADEAASVMTHEFDLSNVKQATLNYSAWYSLEKLWDYGYLIVSEDEGQTWKILHTPSGTDEDPNNNAYGWGYTGSSGGDQPQWVQETVDLTPYAGQKIQIGFQVINDAAVNLPGLAIDDVEIPEINYHEDFEKDSGGWQTDGWIRSNNYVPQQYIAQLVSTGRDGAVSVTRLPIKEDNTAQWDVPLSQLDKAVVVFSAVAPVTSETARFNWAARKK